ncbi:MAG: M48 family metalloprotease [Nitrososphaerales archaeon]|jgi:hypothetical protein
MIGFVYVVYVKLFFGGRKFESVELDALAERMGVLGLLGSTKFGRYFKSKSRISAISFGSRIIFGLNCWNRLNEEQRLALGAHEFVHIKERDSQRKVRRLLVPSLIAAVLTFLLWLSFVHSIPLNLAVLSFGLVLALIAWLVTLALAIGVNARWNRKIELRCDTTAASYVDGEVLIGALEVCDSMVSKKVKNSWTYRLTAKTYPTQEERVEAIRKVIGQSRGSALELSKEGTGEKP